MKTEASNVTVRHSKVVERVATALEDEPRLRGATIDAVDENGVVTLTGTVSSEDVRHAAEEIAQQQEGVIQIINELQLEAGDQEDEMVVVVTPAHDTHVGLVRGP